MRKLFILLIVVVVTTFGFSQDVAKPEFIGEDFSLEGALAMFKKSNSLEEFEKHLNTEENNVNNLDLNDDGTIDYITVDDIVEKDTHIIVLSTYLSGTEKQDIATIGIEKTGAESAILQIEGDENLFAENTIAEPFEVDEKSVKSGNGGPSVPNINTIRIVVNVWFWPCVRVIYAPTYVVYVSSHRWGFYPKWYRQWRPFRNHIFYSNSAHHRNYYHRTVVRRVVVAKTVYAPRRNSSKVLVHYSRKNVEKKYINPRNEGRRNSRENLTTNRKNTTANNSNRRERTLDKRENKSKRRR